MRESNEFMYASLREPDFREGVASFVERREPRLASLGRMSTVIAHEIRNPLAGIAGVIEIIGRDLPDGSPGRDVLKEVQKEVLHISEEREEPANLAIKELVKKAILQIQDMHERQGQTTGISTGFTDLDKLTTGLHPGEMIVIAARPSVGKTSLAMNIAEHVALDLKLPVGVFSLEMSAESLVLRMLCSRARVNLRSIREGFMAERDFPKLTNVSGKLAGAPLIIDDTAGLSILQLRAKARRMHQQHGIKLFVIDTGPLITLAVANIVKGNQSELWMGNLDSIRDWGYAPEYTDGMWRMLQADVPEDFVLATGTAYTIRDFLEFAFAHVGLKWQDYVKFDPKFLRPTEVDELIGDAGTALVLDAGTGIRQLSGLLPKGLKRIDILLTHLHMDHIQGLGFFGPLHNPAVEVHVWGPASTTQKPC